MEINITKPVKVNAKTIKIHVKCSDRFGYEITDQDGQRLFQQDDGYVPSFMPGPHYGDYIILDIDIDTGMVTNWKKPDAEEIEEIIKGEDE
jgi:hypothetical protein